ncbi:hypothetical protein IIY59_02530 [Candidatus Saccharibacteria bacterium]|jgi:glucose uptake protein GlcU|nr:hypothetical protein [Candidatus Saccharibacteria bacterium]MBQ5475178.1 hypothetical protein [Lachnospiraceae bacterium]
MNTLKELASALKDGFDGAQEQGGGGVKGSDTLVKDVITTLVWIVGIASVIVIIYGGILFTTSAGDSGKVKKGKDAILYGIVGLLIAILAYVIVGFVFQNIGVK